MIEERVEHQTIIQSELYKFLCTTFEKGFGKEIYSFLSTHDQIKHLPILPKLHALAQKLKTKKSDGTLIHEFKIQLHNFCALNQATLDDLNILLGLVVSDLDATLGLVVRKPVENSNELKGKGKGKGKKKEETEYLTTSITQNPPKETASPKVVVQHKKVEFTNELKPSDFIFSKIQIELINGLKSALIECIFNVPEELKQNQEWQGIAINFYNQLKILNNIKAIVLDASKPDKSPKKLFSETICSVLENIQNTKQLGEKISVLQESFKACTDVYLKKTQLSQRQKNVLESIKAKNNRLTSKTILAKPTPSLDFNSLLDGFLTTTYPACVSRLAYGLEIRDGFHSFLENRIDTKNKKDFSKEILGEFRRQYFDPASIFLVACYFDVENASEDWDIDTVLEKVDVNHHNSEIFKYLKDFLNGENNIFLLRSTLEKKKEEDPIKKECLTLLNHALISKESFLDHQQRAKCFPIEIVPLLGEYVNAYLKNLKKPEMHLELCFDLMTLLSRTDRIACPVLSSFRKFINGKINAAQLVEELNSILVFKNSTRATNTLLTEILRIAMQQVKPIFKFHIDKDVESIIRTFDAQLPNFNDLTEVFQKTEGVNHTRKEKEIIPSSATTLLAEIKKEMPRGIKIGNHRFSKEDLHTLNEQLEFQFQNLGIPVDKDFYLFLLILSLQLSSPLSFFYSSLHFIMEPLLNLDEHTLDAYNEHGGLRVDNIPDITIKADRTQRQADDGTCSAEIHYNAFFLAHIKNKDGVGFIGNLELICKASKTQSPTGEKYQLEVLDCQLNMGQKHLKNNLPNNPLSFPVLSDLLQVITKNSKKKLAKNEPLFKVERQVILLEEAKPALNKIFTLMKKSGYRPYNKTKHDIQFLSEAIKKSDITTLNDIETELFLIDEQTPSQKLFLQAVKLCKIISNSDSAAATIDLTSQLQVSRWEKSKLWMSEHPIITGIAGSLSLLALASFVVFFLPYLATLITAAAILSFTIYGVEIVGSITGPILLLITSILTGGGFGYGIKKHLHTNFVNAIENDQDLEGLLQSIKTAGDSISPKKMPSTADATPTPETEPPKDDPSPSPDLSSISTSRTASTSSIEPVIEPVEPTSPNPP